MPVDRSLLPPLPGKPDWYVENAPMAVDLTPCAPRPAPLVMPAQQVEAPPSPLPAPAFQTVTTVSRDAHQGRGLSKFKALLHK